MKALLIGAAALLCCAAAARAEDRPRPWSVSARSSFAYMGPASRPTGGMMITATGARSWPIGEASAVSVGAAMTTFGFDTGARWVAILGGPVAAIRTRTWGPLGVGAGVHLDVGRLPTCSAWGFCMLSSGFFPAVTASARYTPSDRVALELVGGARVVRTFPWSGAGGEGGLGATFSF